MPEFDVVEALPDEQLVLPIKGADGQVRRYTIPPVSAEWWWKFAALRQVMTDTEMGTAPAEEDIDLASSLHSLGTAGMKSLCLGADVAQQMITDGVSGADMQRAINAAFAWHASAGDAEQAKRAWLGKGMTTTAPSSKTSSSTGAASTTRRRASSSGTSSRRK